MDDLPRLAAFHDDRRLRPQTPADQVMVQPRDGEQRRDRRAAGVHVPVGEDEKGRSPPDRLVGLDEEPGQRRLEGLAVPVRREEHVEVGGGEVRMGRAAKPEHVLRGEDRLDEAEHAAMLRGLVQKVPLPPDEGVQRHHQLLAERVDRGVRHLGEELLEVGEEHLRPVREDRQRRVVPHRADRLLPLGRHRGDDELDLLLGVAEGVLLAPERLRVFGGDLGRDEEPPQLDLVVLDPLPVRLPAGDGRLDLAVRDDPLLLQVEEEHLPRLEPAAADDPARREVHHPGLRGEDDHPVPRHGVPRGTQPVPVEGGAQVAPVAEDHRRRPVPRLHDRGVVLVEGPLVLAHLELGAPRLGDHHHHGVRQRPARHHEQLEDVVEDGGVAPRLVDDGAQLRDVVAEQRRGEDRLPGPHPVDVPPQRVDLPVVGGDAERVRQVPGGERVRAVPLVDHGVRAHEEFVFQVRVEQRELGSGQEPLVDDRPAGEAGNVELAGVDVVPGGDLLLGEAADDVQLPLEGVPLVGSAPEEELADPRPGGAGEIPEERRVDRHLAPPEDRAPFRGGDPFDGPGAPPGERLVHGKEEHPRGVLAARREVEPVPRAHLAEENVGDLEEEAGAVAGGLVAPQGAAVLQVDQDPDPLLDDGVQGDAVDPGDEPDAAAVVVVLRVVQAGRFRYARGVYAKRVALRCHVSRPFHRVFQVEHIIMPRELVGNIPGSLFPCGAPFGVTGYSKEREIRDPRSRPYRHGERGDEGTDRVLLDVRAYPPDGGSRGRIERS